MKKEFNKYHEDLAKQVEDFYISDKPHATVYLSTGLGKTNALIKICEVMDKTNILILTSHKEAAFNYKEHIKSASVHISTYKEIFSFLNLDFDLVICDEVENFTADYDVFEYLPKGIKTIGFLSNEISEDNCFYNAPLIYSYRIQDALKDGNLQGRSEILFIEKFFVDYLRKNDYTNILTNSFIYVNDKIYRPDVIAKKDNKEYVFEISTYRSKEITVTNINNIMHYITRYQKLSDKYIVIAVLLGYISRELKEDIFTKYNVRIWDLEDIINQCDAKLYDMLSSYVPYDISYKSLNNINVKEASRLEEFESRFANCLPGKENAIAYEKICLDALSYLFDNEFSQKRYQHTTIDGMFVMDLLCSLKGTTEFFNFLKEYYHTKFVVFEFKNYRDCITQNNIFITEKYLFTKALRNVAFIISRKPFDKSAQNAALACLRKENELIFNLTDKDILIMIAKKEKGEEPSDYMLEQVEEYLMSISK